MNPSPETDRTAHTAGAGRDKPDPVVEAMRAKRRELIALPLDRIYRQLFEAGLRASNLLVVAQIFAAPDYHIAAAPLAALVEHFSGPDDAMISVSAGELRALLAAHRKAEGRA